MECLKFQTLKFSKKVMSFMDDPLMISEEIKDIDKFPSEFPRKNNHWKIQDFSARLS
jgi:hypothetical protein